jgi:hypothetical protein
MGSTVLKCGSASRCHLRFMAGCRKRLGAVHGVRMRGAALELEQEGGDGGIAKPPESGGGGGKGTGMLRRRCWQGYVAARAQQRRALAAMAAQALGFERQQGSEDGMARARAR